MEIIVDLHIHSHYSRATSKDSTIEGLYRWGKIKGINVIGTGDFTHPLWFAELQEKLEPAEAGLFQLKEEFRKKIDPTLPQSVRENFIRFILTVEISTIYSKGGKVRKLHNLIISPSFESVSSLNAQLHRIGNLKADGRPILGLDSKELLRMSIETDRRNLFIPAHIWTPWFALFGSKSGFDSIQEAFEELTPHIKAIETGLSSDPFMNWRLKQLQNITMISNSDAHSPQKLGREATVIRLSKSSPPFEGGVPSELEGGVVSQSAEEYLSYDNLVDAIKTNDERLVGTVEFFPQEGKYHYDGHRVCGVKFTPGETKAHNRICPVCHRPLTVGVDYRVTELADHPEDYRPSHHKKVEYIIPLPEMLAEINGVGTGSKKIGAEYDRVIAGLGNEFDILRTLSIDQIRARGFTELAGVIHRMRTGDIHIEPGYDGVYGVIKLFANDTERKKQLTDQISMW